MEPSSNKISCKSYFTLLVDDSNLLDFEPSCINWKDNAPKKMQVLFGLLCRISQYSFDKEKNIIKIKEDKSPKNRTKNIRPKACIHQGRTTSPAPVEENTA